MKTKELPFIGNNPGAVKHGNFINYYSFHAPQERIDQLNPHMFPTIHEDMVIALDIGCNTGRLTIEIHNYLKQVYPDKQCLLLGLDIDPALIERAQNANNDSQITYAAGDIMMAETQSILEKHLEQHNKHRFDIIFCFSITMWIHLNNGDEGLTRFLELIKSISENVIIEPQPWLCYRNAQRRIKKCGGDFPLYHILQIRSEVTSFIESIMGQDFELVSESSESSWQRKVQSYRNR